METCRRMPLQDLPLDQFSTLVSATGGKMTRKHKRPLSPSRSTPLNPAKCRVLDIETTSRSSNAPLAPSSHHVPFMPSSSRVVTPTKPSRLGNRSARNHEGSQGTQAHLSADRQSPSRELFPQPTVESSTDLQSRHYPGFDIFQDAEHHRGSVSPRLSLPPDGNAEGDKENIPVRRKVKKPCSKKRLLSDTPCLGTPARTNRVVRSERIPLSAR